MRTTTSTQFTLVLLLSAALLASNGLAQSPGQVVAWGWSGYGYETNVPAAAQSGVVAMAVGYQDMIALKNDGSVVNWGIIADGSTNVPPDVPPDVPPAAQSGVIAIAAGSGHNLALKNDGSVVAWGNNYYGQTNVPAAAQSGVRAIAAKYQAGHVLALKDDGSVVAWGRGDYGQTNVPAAAQTGVVAIAMGYFHSLALKDDGSVVAWGLNSKGQVTGTPTTNAPFSAIASPVILSGQVLSGVVAIAAGFDYSVVLKDDGSVIAWGNNYRGATDVPTAAQSGVTAIAAGEHFGAALKGDGSVVAWGGDGYGVTNVPIAAQSGVVAVSAGAQFVVALKNNGEIVAWGSNYNGQTNVPTGLTGVTAIAAGSVTSMALRGSGWDLGAPLALRRSNNAMLVSWPAAATGFTLQFTLNLTPPVTWLDVTNPPTVLGGLFTVTNPMSSPAQFFRLRKP